jgi:hypothetical protein
MAELGQTWVYQETDGQEALAQALWRRSLLQDEGHASVIGCDTDPATGRTRRTVTVVPGRPKGWRDAFGDVDAEASADECAHFGLDSRSGSGT